MTEAVLESKQRKWRA